MIITLSPSFAALDENGWQQYLPAIRNLVQAHVQGWHFFVPDRRSASVLLGHPNLPPEIKDILSVFIVERLTVLQSYLNSSDLYVSCERLNEHGVCDGRTIRALMVEYNDLDNCLKSKLIVENAETDASFYVAVAQETVAIGSLLPSFALEVVAGGGDTTAHRVNEALQSPRPSLTIVDSDRTNPTSREGGTATAVRNVFAGHYVSRHRLCVTSVRALENFIPFSVAEQFISDRVGRSRASLFAEWQLREAASGAFTEDCVTAFFGPRKGLKIKAYRSATLAFQKMVDDLCAHLGESFVPPAHNDNSRDKDFAVLPIATDYAGLFLEAFSSSGMAQLVEHFKLSPFRSELSNIAGLVAAFGAAPLKSVVRVAA